MTKPPMLWVNGLQRDPMLPSVSPLDAGFARADGVFETMRVYQGVPFELERHLTRLDRSARILRIDLPHLLPDWVEKALRESYDAGYHEAALRLVLSRGIGSTHGLLPTTREPTVVISVYSVAPGPLTSAPPAVSLEIARCPKNERSCTATAKTLSYTDSIVTFIEATEAGADDALYLNTQGIISEATTANFFFCSGGILKTPRLGCGALEGITRAVVLEQARREGIPVEEGEYSPEVLAEATEAFITSSVREVMPVARIGRWEIGDGGPGPITERLYSLFAGYVRDYCARRRGD